MKNFNTIIIWISVAFLFFGSLLRVADLNISFLQNITTSENYLNISEIINNISEHTNHNKEPQELYLIAWWDIMLSRNIWHLAKQEWYDRIFAQWNYNPIIDFNKCIWENCILFFNLESLFNEKDNDIPRGWFDFRANSWNIKTLQQLKLNHIMALSLANNHTINTTYSWVVFTRNFLSENDILYAWAGTTTWESREFIQIEKNGIKLCIWAYSYEWQFVKVWAGKMAWNSNNESEIKADLLKMNETGCDVKILSLHRWSEYRISPNTAQRDMAHSLVDAWADLILWWHSHVPWEFEIYSGKYIFYSFGNFIFDQWWWRRTPWWNYDHIFDYELKKTTVPTYIWLLAWIQIKKDDNWVDIILDELKMNNVTNWLLQPLDSETYSGILNRINKTWLPVISNVF